MIPGRVRIRAKVQFELEGLVGWPQITLEAFKWPACSRTFWNCRSLDRQLMSSSVMCLLWAPDGGQLVPQLALRELFRRVYTSAAVSLPFQSEKDLPDHKELNPPAEGQKDPAVAGFGSGEISRECCLEEAFLKGGVTRSEE